MNPEIHPESVAVDLSAPANRHVLNRVGTACLDLDETQTLNLDAAPKMSAISVAAGRECSCGDWTLHEFEVVDSTNLIAGRLPAWQAARADRQTAGRGRFQRPWVSDQGGLWLSAVLPVERNSTAWRLLPLVVGLAVCETVRKLGVGRMRLRWPNDVLVDDRKLAGLLVDCFQPGLAVAGIGINVHNHPELSNPALKGQSARLADLTTSLPELPVLAASLLQELRTSYLELQHAGASKILQRVNLLWEAPRPVQLDLDGTLVWGEFIGVDPRGRLCLQLATDGMRFFEPESVRLLRDLPFSTK